MELANRIEELFNRFVREEEGQDLIEYVLIAGFISVVCYVAIQTTGANVNNVWNALAGIVGSIPLG